MRTLLTKNWPKYLPKVVDALNQSPNSAIGGLRPGNIKSPMDDPKIDAAVGYRPEVPVSVQKKNQKEYEKNRNNLQVENHVFLDFTPTTFDKAFDTKRNQIFRIMRIDAGKNPPLYKLKDLMGKPIKGYYYAEQLLKTTKPKRNEYFKVEKILGERIKKGKTEVLVKYLHYGPKFNRWLPKDNVIIKE